MNHHRDLIMAELVRIDDLSKYLKLRGQLEPGTTDVSTDRDFQRLYRDYWRMNVARLSERFYAKYFQLLARGQRSQNIDIAAVTRELADLGDTERRSLQFSFATKLAHMVDPRVPVYDSFVAAFYFYTPPAPDRPFDERLDQLLTFHAFLRREYQRVICDGLLHETLDTFRSRFSAAAAVCDERVMDWIVWAWVSLLRREAQQRGEALYH